MIAKDEPHVNAADSYIDIHKDFLIIRISKKAENIRTLEKVKRIFNQHAKDPRWCAPFDPQHPYSHYLYSKEKDVHRFPLSYEVLELALISFPDALVSEQAKSKIKFFLEEKAKRANEEIARRIRADIHFRELVTILGGINAPFHHGQKRPWQHQQEAIAVLLQKERALIADAPGLGKTYEAALPSLARQRLAAKQGKKLNVYVITTSVNVIMWQRTAEEVGLENMSVFSWQSIPEASDEQPAEDFILIGDEIQYAANLESQRTRKILALSWHPRCVAAIALSGTPFSNGRPVNGIGPLLFVKHPLLYPAGWEPKYPISWDLKNSDGHPLPGAMARAIWAYKQRYCDAKRVIVNRRTGKEVWDFKGASNTEEFNKTLRYHTDRSDNPQTACMIARLQHECLDLPKKRRILKPVELSKEEITQLKSDLQNMWHDFHVRAEERLEAWRTVDFPAENDGKLPDNRQIREKRQAMLNAEAVVSYMFLRRACARAKVSGTVEVAGQYIANGEKIIIFTTFLDVAQKIGDSIEKEFGVKCGYITGEQTNKKRQATIDDFQRIEGETQVTICSSAGGEGITLHAAHTMLIVDRPWTSEKALQEEARAWRAGQEHEVTVFWLQINPAICTVDIRVDALILAKQGNAEELTYGRQYGLLDIHKGVEQIMNANAYGIIQEALHDVKNYRGSK